MYTSLRHIFRSERGNITLALVAIAVISSVIYFLMGQQGLNKKTLKLAEADLEAQAELYFGQDTLLYAFRIQEMNYYKAVKDCSTYRPFLSALKSGSGCAMDVQVFNSLPQKDGSMNNILYRLDGPGCLIKIDSSTCNNFPLKILTVESKTSNNVRLSPFKSLVYEFYISNILEEHSTIEFAATFKEKNKLLFGQTGKRIFSLMYLPRNFAHMHYDGRVLQENPSPLARCSTVPWTDFQQFNPDNLKCEKFSVIGGMDGLAFYNGRFVGFRPQDGQIFDLYSTLFEPEGRFFVDENGKLNSVSIFPPYNKALLVNVNDITLIDDTIYFVTQGAEDAIIGILDMRISGSPSRKTLCEIGKEGWATSFEGITADGGSADLLRMEEGARATFYLKSSSNGLVTIIAAVVKDTSTNQLKYECYGYKDPYVQSIEYLRTLGFDRADDVNTFINY